MFLVGFWGCSNDSNVAGNSAETGSPELAGILYLDNGSPAALARVRCVPSQFDVLNDTLPENFQSFADDSGAYVLEGLTAGKYSLEAFDPNSGKMLLVQNIEVSDSGRVAVSDTLQSSGYMMLDMDDVSLDGSEGSALVVGTTIMRPIKVDGNVIVVDSLPADTLDLQLYLNDGKNVIDFENVNVPAADTAKVHLTRDTVVAPVDTVIHRYVAPLAWPIDADTSYGTYSSDIPIALRLDSSNCDFKEFENREGRWEVYRISADGSRSASLPIAPHYFDVESQKALFWVRVDSLNVADSLELVFNSSKAPVYAMDVFPTSRVYTAVYHFDNDLKSVEDDAEKQNFVGTGVGLKAVDGVLGSAASFNGESYMVVDGSAATDSSKVSDLNYIGTNFFTFSLWVKLDDVKTTQTILAKGDRLYDLRFVPDSGFVMSFYHKADAFKGGANDTSDYKLVKHGGTDQVKAGQWTFISVNRGEKLNMFVNDKMVEEVAAMVSWDGKSGEEYDFEVGRLNGSAGPDKYFKGVVDELFAAGSERSGAWTMATYLNQRPGEVWPKIIAE